MSKLKYITSGGLAFSENKDMEKLRSYSRKGWHVSDFAFMGYTLKKGPEADYIYNVDYRYLSTEEEEEYVEFFSFSGWSHVASEGNIHLFRAEPGTVPIYSDRETTKEKYRNSSKSITPLALSVIVMALLFWVGASLSTGGFHTVLNLLANISTVLAVPLAMTLTAVSYTKWQAEDKNGLVNIMKVLIGLISLAIFIILLYLTRSGEGWRLILTVLVAGAAVLTLIWAVMSLYHSMGRKKA